ncbi:hypothetical protein IL306_013300 [Fusarium sp. DS 682]|nr:hypothetical protein IL306_013300 [Fusarium sp. DS 682]
MPKADEEHFRKTTGVEVARTFYWRFGRSIDKACQLMGKGLLTYEEVEEQWTKFLDWITQRSFEKPARRLLYKEFEMRPRSLVDVPEEDRYHGVYYLKFIKYDGSFIRPKIPKRREWFRHAKSHLNSQSLVTYEEAQLAVLVHSEIRRRRLAERVFAFLFDNTRNIQSSPGSKYDNVKDILANEQLLDISEPFITEWKRENEAWNVVENYVSESERHMNSLKFKLLDTFEGNRSAYREIVII